jgi:hypothetical protein
MWACIQSSPAPKPDIDVDVEETAVAGSSAGPHSTNNIKTKLNGFPRMIYWSVKFHSALR